MEFLILLVPAALAAGYLANINNNLARLRNGAQGAVARARIAGQTRGAIDVHGGNYTTRGTAHAERVARTGAQRGRGPGGRGRGGGNGWAAQDNANGWPTPTGVGVVIPAMNYGVEARRAEQLQRAAAVDAAQAYNLALNEWPHGAIARHVLGHRPLPLQSERGTPRRRNRPADARNRFRRH